MPDYNLFGLDSRSFEQLIQALSVNIIGSNIVIFGDGPDGGREASFNGAINYPNPNPNAGWNGYGVIQAKFKQKSEGAGKDGKWALNKLKKELEKFIDEKKDLKKPEYYIFATNISLSSVNKTGAKDKLNALLESYKSQLPIKGFALWDNDQIRVFLENNKAVRECYSAWITPGDVLAELIKSLSIRGSDFQEIIENYLLKELVSDHYVNLGQAGHTAETNTALGRVFVDLCASTEQTINPPDEEENGAHKKGFTDYAITIGDQNLRPSMSTSLQDRKDKQKNGRYVLIGGPGQGKTTIGQFICQLYRVSLFNDSKVFLTPEAKEVITEVSEQCISDEIKLPLCRRFPIRIVLNEYASVIASMDKNSPQTVLAFILNKIKQKTNCEVSYGDFKSWLKNYPWLLVLDGLDEVPASSNREELLNTVSDFLIDVSQLDADIMIIATSRPQGYDKSRDFSAQYYQHYYLSPLSAQKALFYGSRLAKARYCGDQERINKVITRLERATKQAETVRLMRSPLQVTIMATLVDNIGQPPQERWRLFKEYYEVIGRREKERDIPAADIIRDYKPDIDALHSRVGLQLQVESEQEKNTEARLNVKRFQTIIRNRLLEEEHEEDSLKILMEQIITAATERLVFLVGIEAEKIGFEIRSLQEFMAAECLVDKSDKLVRERLRTIATASHWRNVFLFACGKCFAERQHLRDSILTICNELNETDASGISKSILVGSVLSLDLIEDGPARKQPKYSNALMRNALKLLDIKIPDYAFRLAEVYESSFEAVYREEIIRRIKRENINEAFISWLVLLYLVEKGEGWAVDTANSYWFSMQTIAIDFFAKLSDSRDVNLVLSEYCLEKIFLAKKLTIGLLQIIRQLPEEHSYPFKFRKNHTILGEFNWDIRDMDNSILIAFNFDGKKESAVTFSFNSLKSNTYFAIKKFLNFYKNQSFDFLFPALQFCENPSKELLVSSIKSFSLEEKDASDFFLTYLPWPIAICLDF